MLKHHYHRAKQSPYTPGVIALVVYFFIAIVVIVAHAPKPGTVSFTQVAAATTLSDYGGGQIKFESYNGRPLVVYFWATWCPYCGGELQNLAQVKAKEGGNIQILAVNRGEPLATAKAFTDNLGLQKSGLVFLLDNNDALFKKLNGYAMPETIFIDRLGNVVVHQRGPSTPDIVDTDLAQITH